MREESALANILPTLSVEKFEGDVHRAVTLEALYGFHHDPPYPSVRPLYNLGAPATGARYTPRNGMPCLYLASDMETAFAEVNQVYAAMGRLEPPIRVATPPCVLYSIRVSLEYVLDLTNSEIQTALGTDPIELNASWREAQKQGSLPPTQRLGKMAYECQRIQALRYPSAQNPPHTCYVVFTDRLRDPDYVEVYDPDGNLRERLPAASTPSPQLP